MLTRNDLRVGSVLKDLNGAEHTVKREAREKAFNDDYAINEIMDFKTEVIDEWED